MNKYKYETRKEAMQEINDMTENGMVYRAVSRELELRKSVSVHSWIMPDECSEMLTNSKDGILRIKITN